MAKSFSPLLWGTDSGTHAAPSAPTPPTDRGQCWRPSCPSGRQWPGGGRDFLLMPHSSLQLMGTGPGRTPTGRTCPRRTRALLRSVLKGQLDLRFRGTFEVLLPEEDSDPQHRVTTFPLLHSPGCQAADPSLPDAELEYGPPQRGKEQGWGVSHVTSKEERRPEMWMFSAWRKGSLTAEHGRSLLAGCLGSCSGPTGAWFELCCSGHIGNPRSLQLGHWAPGEVTCETGWRECF